MSNIFYNLYEQVLLETLGLPRNSFKQLIEYVVEMYKNVKINNIERITPNNVPPKVFNIDFNNTSFEHLNIINPRIQLFFSQTGDCHFDVIDKDGKSFETIKNGKGYIHINLKNRTLKSILTHIMEHELWHYIQFATVTYKIKKGYIKDIPIGKYEQYLGGIPSKKLLPKDVSTYGYKISSQNDNKKYIVYSNYSGLPIKRNGKWNKPIYSAKSPLEAIEKARKNDPILAQQYGLIAKEMKQSIKKRIQHSARPIEYYTDLLSMIRMLQFSYTIHENIISKKDFFNYFIGSTTINPHLNDVYIMLNKNNEFLNAKHILSNFKKALKTKKYKKLYNVLLKRLYDIFMNHKYSNDFEDIKQIVNKTIQDIDKEKNILKLKQELKNEETNNTVELNLSESDFLAPSLKLIRGDDWLTDLDDFNTDNTQLLLSMLNINEKVSNNRQESYYIIPMNYKNIKHIFITLRDIVKNISSTSTTTFNGKKDDIDVSDLRVILEASRELFLRIQDHLQKNSNTHKEIPSELYYIWMKH